MRKLTLISIMVILLLASCNLPTGPGAATPTPDAIATKVSQMLTQAPTTTGAPTEAATSPSSVPAASSTPAPATPTTAATAATAPTATTAPAGPTPTTPSGDPKNALGNPTWHDSLDSGKSFYQYESDNTVVKLEGGALVLTAPNADGWLGWSLTHSHSAQNFYIEATFKTDTCSGTDTYGLVFRAPSDEAGYFYHVTCNGKYNLHARNFSDNSDNTLVDLTANNAILSGSNQTNRLGIMAKGDTISLYANGVLLKEVKDSTFKDAGYFGALIAANDTPGFTARMEDVSLWVLP